MKNLISWEPKPTRIVDLTELKERTNLRLTEVG